MINGGSGLVFFPPGSFKRKKSWIIQLTNYSTWSPFSPILWLQQPQKKKNHYLLYNSFQSFHNWKVCFSQISLCCNTPMTWQRKDFWNLVMTSKQLELTDRGIRPSQHGLMKGRSCLTNLISFYNKWPTWSRRNLLHFNKRKCHVLHLRRNNPSHQYRMGAAQMKMTWGVLVAGKKFNMSQQFSPCGKSGQQPPGVH